MGIIKSKNEGGREKSKENPQSMRSQTPDNRPTVQRPGEEGFVTGRLFGGQPEPEVNAAFATDYQSLEKDVRSRMDANACPHARLSDYEIKGLIAGGGFAKVWRIARGGALYALKVQTKDQVTKAELLREKKLHFALQSDFIVKLLFVSQDSKYVYHFMDYGIYGTLVKLKKKSIPELTMKYIAAQMLFAISYVHAAGYIHGDVKPLNVIIYEDLYVKLADFGHAVESTARELLRSGTQQYKAPEMYFPDEYGKGIDWWAYGVTVYELLYGDLPFEFLYWDKEWVKRKDKSSGKFNIPLKFPSGATEKAKDFISGLLHGDRTRRTGWMLGEWRDVARHAWFDDVDLDEIFYKRVRYDLVNDFQPAKVDESKEFKAPQDEEQTNWIDGF